MEDAQNNPIMRPDTPEQDEAIRELYRRGRVRKYFQGAGDFRTGEGFGYLVGGGLCVLMGAWIFPMLFAGHTASGVERYLFWIMTGIGIYLSVKGMLVMGKEDKTARAPVTDEQFDEIFRGDLADAKKTAGESLRKEFGLPEDSTYIHLYGPNYYSANRHLPLLWKTGRDGKIRYSNFSLVTLCFHGEDVYAHTSVFNCRNGELGLSHTFSYAREKLRGPAAGDRTVERLTAERKIETKEVSLLMIAIEGKEEINELSVVMKDYQILGKGGRFDLEENLAAAERLRERLSAPDKARLRWDGETV